MKDFCSSCSWHDGKHADRTQQIVDNMMYLRCQDPLPQGTE